MAVDIDKIRAVLQKITGDPEVKAAIDEAKKLGEEVEAGTYQTPKGEIIPKGGECGGCGACGACPWPPAIQGGYLFAAFYLR